MEEADTVQKVEMEKVVMIRNMGTIIQEAEEEAMVMVAMAEKVDMAVEAAGVTDMEETVLMINTNLVWMAYMGAVVDVMLMVAQVFV